MTSPDGLLSAIRAALDDTERLAQRVADRYVSVRDGQPFWPLPTVRARFRDTDPDIAAGLTLIEMFGPATVLRLVAAMREIVDLHHSQPASGFDTDGWEHHGYGCAVCYFADSYPCPTIRALARGLGIDPEETP